MQGSGEELSVEPLRMSRRTRSVLGGGGALLACLSLLTGSPGSTCAPPTDTPGAASSPAPPWLASDDPLVLALHYGALDRRRSRGDAPPKGVLSVEAARTARKVGDDAGVAVYLADGPDFVCLGVDGRRAGYGVGQECLLDVSVANQGLSVGITSTVDPSSTTDRVDALDSDALLVVAVPDHAQLQTEASTKHVADYANASVLQPGQDEIVLRQRGQPPVVINRSSRTAFAAGC